VQPDLTAWRRRLEPLTDPLIALAAFGLSILPLLQADLSEPGTCGCGPIPFWAYPMVAAQCAPLAVRRRFPFVAPLVAGVVTMAHGLTSLPDPPVEYAGLIAIYTVAAYARRRLANAAAVIAAVGTVGVFVLDWPRSDYEDVTVTILLLTTAWLLGENTRSRRARIAEVEARAEQLERTRAVEAQAAVVAERNRIAREMHDVVAHHVSMMVVQAEAGPVVVGHDPARAVASFDAISAAGKQALSEMRRLLGVLKQEDDRPLAPQPGLSRIPDLVAGVRAAGLDVELDFRPPEGQLDAALDLSGYRLVQETLTNALRHAGPSRVRVAVFQEAETLVLDIVDDGVGGMVPPGTSGHGLVAMRERVTMLGGRLDAGPRDGGGWAVAAVLPLSPVPVS
jgi:signal transduction histidine kinase